MLSLSYINCINQRQQVLRNKQKKKKKKKNSFRSKARVLEETLNSVTTSSGELEKELKRMKYALESEKTARSEEVNSLKAHEKDTYKKISNYEVEVRNGFELCKARHAEVWEELVKKRKLLSSLRDQLQLGKPITSLDTIIEQPVSETLNTSLGYASPISPTFSSPELTIEETLLERHDRLSLSREVLVSPTLVITEPSPEAENRNPHLPSSSHSSFCVNGSKTQSISVRPVSPSGRKSPRFAFPSQQSGMG